MTSNFIRFAFLKLDAEGTEATAKLHGSPKNLYWKHKVVVKNNRKYDLEGMSDSLMSVDLPNEMAMYLNIGDVLTFIQEEDPEDDVLLNALDYYTDDMKSEYIRWKEFLGDKSLGIYIYKKEFLFGLDRLNLHGFYYDEEAVSKDIDILNRPKKRTT